MLEKINERVSVVTIYSRTTGQTMPVQMRWQGRDYRIRKLGHHHQTRQGRVWVHIFSVSTDRKTSNGSWRR